MDVDNETEFLVVDLENCVSADIRNLNKSNIYSNSLSLGNSHDLRLAATDQSLGNDLNQSFCRIQLQPLHYQQFQVNYDGNNTHGLSPLYQNSTLGNYSPSLGYSSPFLQSLSPLGQASIPDPSNPSPPPNSPTPPPNPPTPPANSPTSPNPPTPPPNPPTPPPNPPTPPPLPPPPKERRKHLPIDPNDIPHFPINDYEYYKEIKQLLVLDKYPEGVSDNYKIHLRKRARHYLIIDSVLYHNPKKPKKVIMRKLEQMNLLESTHVSPDSGIHLGILKMLDLIHGEYFWRGLYEDVASFVNNCPKCRDSVDLAQRREKEFRRLGADFSDDEMEYAYATSAVQTSSTVWARVEIQVHGPFKITENRNEYVLTITDPESCFVHATALPRIGCATKITEFILKTFYTFGFPQPCFINDKNLYDEVVMEYDCRLKQTAWKTKLHWQECSECPWVSQLAELLIVRKADRWDKEMDKFMFQFRAGCIRDAPLPKDAMPFYSMFQRLPYHDDKENVEVWIKGKNHLQCAECDDIFISKVGLRLHKKQHFLEEARKTSLLEYAIEKHESQEGGELEKSRVKVAMGEIKNYLAKTKDIRRRRGKYQKYSVEIQEHMIAYAKKHGTKKAASHFSQLIGSNVSDSTIRNLLKASVHFLPRTKEEIARYAIEFGIDKASKYFSEILNKDVPSSLVNKFRILYGGKFLKKDKDNSDKHKKNKNEKMINNLTDEEKDSIGNYACDHTTQETINYFDEKMNIKLGENDVKEFQKTYLDKQQKTDFFEIPTESNISNVTYQALPAGSVCFSPSGSIVEIQDTSYSYEDIGYNEALQYQDTGMIQPENTQQQQEQRVEESAVVDHFLLLSDENPTAGEVSISDKPENSRKSEEWDSECYQVVYEERPVFQVEVPPSSDFQSKVDEVITKPSPDSAIDQKEPKRKPKKKEGGKKRGSYTTYSPELRAKIGKYAAEHSTLKASNHFSKILGHDLPESTARGLKERYLSKVRHCDVTSLGFSSRGRPLRLGKYDEVVQECLKELVRSGERMTSFLAITTARQILNKLEPSLLHENGGTIILNNTWAKSILKRIGVRNNS